MNKRGRAAQSTVQLCLSVWDACMAVDGSCLSSQWGLQVLEAPRTEQSCCLTCFPAPSLTSILMQNWRGCCLVVCLLALCVYVRVGFGVLVFLFFLGFFKLEVFEGNAATMVEKNENWNIEKLETCSPRAACAALSGRMEVTLKECSLVLSVKMAACRKRRTRPCVYFPRWLLMPKANCIQPKPRARQARLLELPGVKRNIRSPGSTKSGWGGAGGCGRRGAAELCGNGAGRVGGDAGGGDAGSARRCTGWSLCFGSF